MSSPAFFLEERKMKIKLRKTLAKDTGCFEAGSVIEVSESEGKYLVKSEQADAVEEESASKEAEIERAEVVPGEETAQVVRRRRGR